MKNSELEAPRVEAGPSFTSQLTQQDPMADLGGDVPQNIMDPWNFIAVPPFEAPVYFPDQSHAGPSSMGSAFHTG